MIRSWIVKYIKNSQRGVFIILFAIMLPLLIALGGFAIEVGNLYSHYTLLQNAADSAAMAAGSTFKNEKGDLNTALTASIPTALKYTEKNEIKPALNYKTEYAHPDDNIRVKCEAKKKTGYSMLKVTLYEDVPYHFIRPLLSLLHFDDDKYYVTIVASGYCKIIDGIKNNGYSNQNLFTFSDGLRLINNLPQSASNEQQRKDASSTYDGDIRAAKREALYNISVGNKIYDLTEEPFKSHIGNPNDIDGEIYSKDYIVAVRSSAFSDKDWFYVSKQDRFYYPDNNRLNSTDINYPYYNGDIDITTLYTSVIQPMEKADSTYVLKNNNHIYDTTVNEQILAGKNAIFADNSGGAVEIDFNNPIGKATDDPFYIITNNFGNCHINTDFSNCRPIIFVSTSETATLNFQPSTKGFNGMLYAPYGNIYINDSHIHFTGSVMGKYITSDCQAYYELYDYIGNSTPTTSPNSVTMGGSDEWDD